MWAVRFGNRCPCLHLADSQDVTTNGKAITAATQPISVVLDPEAAKIIQSIGKMTVAVKE